MTPKARAQEALDAVTAVHGDYRFYTCDASIEGRFRVMFALRGQAYEDWHLTGEVLDTTGKDTRPEMFISGVGETFQDAILAALEKMEKKDE